MPVSVEISGLLERRLRRLVDLGLYSSVSEAVRDSIRAFLEKLDLKALALELYTSKEASLGYIIEFSGETFDSIIDYMISHGIPPLIGALNEASLEIIEGNVIVDPITLHVIYKSYIVDLIAKLSSGFKVYAPSTVIPQVQVLEAIRARRGLNNYNYLEYVELTLGEEESYTRILVSPLEKAVISYARDNNLILISDDIRVRTLAERFNVRSLSSLSIIQTYIEKFGKPNNVGEIILALKAIPVIIPRSIEERWSKGG